MNSGFLSFGISWVLMQVSWVSSETILKKKSKEKKTATTKSLCNEICLSAIVVGTLGQRLSVTHRGDGDSSTASSSSVDSPEFLKCSNWLGPPHPQVVSEELTKVWEQNLSEAQYEFQRAHFLILGKNCNSAAVKKSLKLSTNSSTPPPRKGFLNPVGEKQLCHCSRKLCGTKIRQCRCKVHCLN